MYPLDLCTTCSHRNVCKLIKELNKFQNKVKEVDITYSDCEEYVVDLTADGYEYIDDYRADYENQEEYQVTTSKMEPDVIDNPYFLSFLQQTVDKGLDVKTISMSSKTMHFLLGKEYVYILYGDHTIEIEQDDSLDFLAILTKTEGE